MKGSKGSVAVTFEDVDGETGAVTGSVECRIHFYHRPGDPGCRYMNNGDPGYPPEPAETELDFLEVESVENGKHVWTRYAGPALGEADLADRAQTWLDDHPDEVEQALPQGPDPDDARDAAWEDREYRMADLEDPF